MQRDGDREKEGGSAEAAGDLGACVGKTLGEVDASGVFERAAGKPKVTGIAFDDGFIEREVGRTFRELVGLVTGGGLRLVPRIDKATGLPKVNATGEVQAAPNLPNVDSNLKMCITTLQFCAYVPLADNVCKGGAIGDDDTDGQIADHTETRG